MPTITFTVTTAAPWFGGAIEDGHQTIELLDFGHGVATHEVPGGSLATFTLYAKGEAGTEVSAEIEKDGAPIARKRTYKIEANNNLARNIQFDPDK